MPKITVTVDVGGKGARPKSKGRRKGKTPTLIRQHNESKRFDHPSMLRMKRT